MKIRRGYGTVAFALAGSLFFLANTTAAAPPDKKNPLVLESYRSFFVGGQRVPAGCPASGEDCKLDGHAYVEAFIPQRQDRHHRAPIIMMHASISATIFLEAANGTEGAAIVFARGGHPVYVVDPPGTGRAPRDIDLLDDLGDISQGNSSTWRSWKNGPAFGELGWNDAPDRSGGPIDPVHPPGDTTTTPMNQLPCDSDTIAAFTLPCTDPDPEGVNQFIGHRAVLRTNVPGVPSQNDPVRDAAVIALLEKIGEPVIWMGWSAGGLLGQRLVVQRPDLFAAWAAFEGCAVSTVLQPRSSQYTPQNWNDFLDTMIEHEIPFLHVNPDYGRDVGRGLGRHIPSGGRCILGDDADPRNHASKFITDNCPSCKAEDIYAPEEGVFGNGHMMMFQNNIEEYAQISLDWFKENLK